MKPASLKRSTKLIMLYSDREKRGKIQLTKSEHITVDSMDTKKIREEY